MDDSNQLRRYGPYAKVANNYSNATRRAANDHSAIDVEIYMQEVIYGGYYLCSDVDATILELRAQVESLKNLGQRVDDALSASEQRVGQLLKAMNDHNHDCQARCGFDDQEAVECKYRPYFENTGRRCPTCPTYEKIDIPVASS